MKNIFLMTLSLFTAVSCNTVSQMEMSRIKNEPFVIDNTYKYARPTDGTRTGTIFKGEQVTNTFFVDQRAKGIGDIITINIVEVSSASEQASTDTKRSSNIHAGIPNLFGQEVKYISNHPYLTAAQLLNANTQNDFSGSGSTTRGGSLSASISAKVVDVLPSGNLAIVGKREIYINNEKKEILLQGLVRPRDIAYDNSVLSTQVADAKIIYTGIGVIGEKQRPGWLARVFDLVWPF
ncbi:MAG: flagellar biosynthesis protein FlgH [Syntrophus sp. (in: bacteria)]|nr:flagellar biosynthesis protein FlgH [Syntrophus sp. (in: bacteria)]